MKVVSLTFGKGIATEFTPFTGKVVTTRNLGLQAIATQSLLNDGELLPNVIQLFVGNEREVDVTQVVIDSTTTCTATHQMTALVQQQLYVTLRIRILVVADNDRLLVLPQIHGNYAFLLMLGEILFHSPIEERIVLVADDDL